MSIWFSQTPLNTIGQTASRALSGVDGISSARPERQRGLWNFLTWSFFLANFLTATEVAGGGAHAAGMNDGNSPDGSHTADASAHASTSQQPGNDAPALENAPVSAPLPESEGRLATNLISPSAISANQSQDLSSSSTSGAHWASSSFGGSTIYQADNNSDVSSQPGHADPVGPGVGIGSELTNVVDQVVGTVVQTVGDVVGTATHVLGGVMGDVGHAATTVVAALGDTIDTTLHSVTTALASPGDLMTNLPASIGTVASSLDHVLTTAATEVVQAPLNILHAASTDLGIAAPGSLNFSTATPEHSLADAPSGYSQYNLSVQDIAAADGHAIPSDMGSITNIISSALGIGHLSNTDQTSSDHSNDHHQPLDALINDLNGSTHHNLFG